MQQNHHPISQTPTPPTPRLVEAYRCVLDWDVFAFLLIWYTPSAGSLWKSRNAFPKSVGHFAEEIWRGDFKPETLPISQRRLKTYCNIFVILNLKVARLDVPNISQASHGNLRARPGHPPGGIQFGSSYVSTWLPTRPEALVSKGVDAAEFLLIAF